MSRSSATHQRIERDVNPIEVRRDMDELTTLVDRLDRAEIDVFDKVKSMRRKYGVDIVIQRDSARVGLRPLFSFVPMPEERKT